MVEISPNQVAKAFFSVWLKHFNPFRLSAFLANIHHPLFFLYPKMDSNLVNPSEKKNKETELSTFEIQAVVN